MPEKKQYRILLVEDESDLNRVFKRGLEIEGFSVNAFTSPLDALEHFKVGYYDLALLDLKMPEMTGFELYRALKKQDEKLKVCFITAFEAYFEEFQRIFPKVRVSCFVRKPVSIPVLAKIIIEEMEWNEEFNRTGSLGDRSNF